MKILYAVQGTGNGHIARARDIVPYLKKYAEVDILVSGIQSDITFDFPVKHKLYGLSFMFGRSGGVDIWATWNKARLANFIKEIANLDLSEYNFIVNDFEPVSAWASKLKKKPVIGMSHQAAVLHPKAPRPNHRDFKGTLVLKHYAPVIKSLGFHFQQYSPEIFTPVIRKQIRHLDPQECDHITVYLPAYGIEYLLGFLQQFSNVKWHIFSKHDKKTFQVRNCTVMTVDNDRFVQDMANSRGVLCGAGFETPAEALFLGKKLLVIPMSNQYEQQCNAAALAKLGVSVLNRLDASSVDSMHAWIASDQKILIDFPEKTQEAVEKALELGKQLEDARMSDFILR